MAEPERLGKWLDVDEHSSMSGKTRVWTIHPAVDKPGDALHEHAGATLGRVKWCGQWRRYAFYPEPGSWYEADCLREIADFCARKTREHRSRGRVRQGGGLRNSPRRGDEAD